MKDPKFTRRHALKYGAASAAALICGTGAYAQSDEGEVGGGIGGTGIVGLLTGFGSLYVNGHYITMDANTVYSDGFGPVQKSDLRVGYGLTVEAAGPLGGLVARRVHVTDPVVGAISAIEAGGTVIRINGVRVQLVSRLRGFGISDRVAVSGLWRGDTVVASVVSLARSQLDLVSGVVSTRIGRPQIGPVRIGGRAPSPRNDGSFATAVGQFDPNTGVFAAQSVTPDRFIGAAGSLRRLSIEGYLEPINAAPGFRVAGLGHSFARNVRFETSPQERLLLSGPYAGSFAVERAIVLPENATARGRMLGQIQAQQP